MHRVGRALSRSAAEVIVWEQGILFAHDGEILSHQRGEQLSKGVHQGNGPVSLQNVISRFARFVEYNGVPDLPAVAVSVECEGGSENLK